jgi:hypothetical protein
MMWKLTVVLGVVACGDVSSKQIDAPVAQDVAVADTPAPDAPPLPASCKAIHTASPVLGSGTYMIDPDGSGPDAPLSVTCDMAIEGGGWTIVFFPPDANYNGTADYTSSTERLLADATQTLIAYRSASQVAYTNYATFDLPTEWKTTSPMNATGTDITTGVSINGGPLASTQVRYGKANFASLCSDAWSAATAYGRVCVVGTIAPYFSGFNASTTDQCSNSSQAYNTTSCSNDLRFSIAVR